MSPRKTLKDCRICQRENEMSEMQGVEYVQDTLPGMECEDGCDTCSGDCGCTTCWERDHEAVE